MLTDLYKRFLTGEEVEIWPQRGSNAVPIAFNPNTGLIYTTRGTCHGSRSSPHRNRKCSATNSTGVVGRPPTIKPGDVLGHFVAINPLTGEKKWEMPLTDMPSSAGMLVTEGACVYRQDDG